MEYSEKNYLYYCTPFPLSPIICRIFLYLLLDTPLKFPKIRNTAQALWLINPWRSPPPPFPFVLIPTPFRKKNVQYVKNCTLLPRLFRGDFYERQPELKRFSHLHNTEKKKVFSGTSVSHIWAQMEREWNGRKRWQRKCALRVRVHAHHHRFVTRSLLF